MYLHLVQRASDGASLCHIPGEYEVNLYLIGLSASTLAVRLRGFLLFPALISLVPWACLGTLCWILCRCFGFPVAQSRFPTPCNGLGSWGAHAIDSSACGGGAGTAKHFPTGCPKEQNETIPEYAGQHFLLAGSVLKRQRAVGGVRRNVLLKDGWFLTLLLCSWHGFSFLRSPKPRAGLRGDQSLLRRKGT